MKVIIVGSGIVGSSTAYHLVKKGIHVTVIDNKHKGKATLAGAGIVSPWTKKDADPDWYKLAEKAANYYPNLIHSLMIDGESNVGYRKVGALLVSTNESELDEIEKLLVSRQQKNGDIGEVLRTSAKRSKELFPLLKENLEAIYVSGAARVDGKLLSEALQRAATKEGAVFIKGTALLEEADGKVKGVSVEGKFFDADKVILASGAWTNKLLSPLGFKSIVEPQRGQIIHFKLSNQNTKNWPVILPLNDYYFVSFDDSRVVGGATRETGSGFDYRLTAKGIKEVLEQALYFAPGLENASIHEMRIGFRPMGPDTKPILGEVDELEGLIIATGLGATGLTTGPYVGLLAANLAVDESFDINLSPFNPIRY